MTVYDSRDLLKEYKDLSSERQDLLNAIDDKQEEINDMLDNIDGLEVNNQDDQVKLEEFKDHLDELQTDMADLKYDLSEWDNEYSKELANLEEINEVGRIISSDWKYGVSIITASEIDEYIEDKIYDLWPEIKNAPDWIVVDLKTTIENLKSDYQEINFRGDLCYVQND